VAPKHCERVLHLTTLRIPVARIAARPSDAAWRWRHKEPRYLPQQTRRHYRSPRHARLLRWRRCGARSISSPVRPPVRTPCVPPPLPFSPRRCCVAPPQAYACCIYGSYLLPHCLHIDSSHILHKTFPLPHFYQCLWHWTLQAPKAFPNVDRLSLLTWLDDMFWTLRGGHGAGPSGSSA